MTDPEVETTLREIRERVRAEVKSRAPLVSAAHAGIEAEGADANGASASASFAAADALARIEANLATAERARERLPPLMSNRAGAVARLELWVKRLIKRATHWFTWEQVNYNAAVYHALRDARDALAATAAETAELRRSLAQTETARASLDARLADTEARLASAEERFTAERDQMRDAFADSLSRVASELRAEQTVHADALRREQSAVAQDLRAEQAAHAESLRTELRERVAHALEEQRVSFKQLSLEAGERAVLQDRARRRVEARLEEIAKKVTSDE